MRSESERSELVGSVGKRGGYVLFAFVWMALFGVDLLISPWRGREEASC